MKISLPPSVRTIGISAAVLVFLLGGASVFSYGVLLKQWDGPMVRFLSQVTRFPAARVGSRSLSYQEYLKHADALKRFLSGPAAKALGVPLSDESSMRKQALDRMIRIVVIEDIAIEEKLNVTSAQIDEALKNVTDRMLSPTTTEAEIEAFSRSQFGWDVKDLKTFVIRPALLEDGLRQKYASGKKDFDASLDQRMNGSEIRRYLRLP